MDEVFWAIVLIALSWFIICAIGAVAEAAIFNDKMKQEVSRHERM